jgi:hypothetical protein
MNSPSAAKAYFSAASQLHNTQITSLLSLLSNLIKKVPDDDPENSP